jgi:hypothetical protein
MRGQALFHHLALIDRFVELLRVVGIVILTLAFDVCAAISVSSALTVTTEPRGGSSAISRVAPISTLVE